jgi:hypothetical protein
MHYYYCFVFRKYVLGLELHNCYVGCQNYGETII